MIKLFCCACVIAASLEAGVILTFDQTNPSIAGGETIANQAYGDRVAATSDAVGGYGTFDTGFTQNIVVEYGDGAGPVNNTRLWATGYGDLTNVLYNNADGDDRLTVTFTADPGYVVRLHSFDLAGWPSADYTIAGVRVHNGTTDLFSQTNVLVRGSLTQNPRHTTFSFSTPLEGEVLQIYINLTGLGGASDNIGIDNIAFSQFPESAIVPEPSTFLTSAGAALLVILTRRRR